MNNRITERPVTSPMEFVLQIIPLICVVSTPCGEKTVREKAVLLLIPSRTSADVFGFWLSSYGLFLALGFLQILLGSKLHSRILY